MRRWLCIGVSGVLTLGAVALAIAIAFSDRVGAWVVEERAVPAIEDRLPVEVDVGDVELGFGTGRAREVVIRGAGGARAPGADPIASLAEVDVEFGLLSALRGAPEIGAVTIRGAELRLSRGDGGQGDIEVLAAAWAEADEPAGPDFGEGDAERREFRRLELEDAILEYRDERAGVAVTLREVEADLDPEGASAATIGALEASSRFGLEASASDLRARADLGSPLESARLEIGDGGISLAGEPFADLALTGIRGELALRQSGEVVELDLEGSYGGADEPLWAAEGQIDARDITGEISVDAERFSLDRVAHVLGDAPIRRPAETELAGSLRVMIGPEEASFRGDVAISGLTVAHPMLASEPLADLAAEGRVRGRVDRLARALSVERATLEIEGVDYDVEGFVWLPGGIEPIEGGAREGARAGGRIAVGPVDCADMLASIPDALVPDIRDFELAGVFEADLHVDVDLEHPRATDLGGSIDIDGCRVEGAPPRMRAARLARGFTYGAQVTEDQTRPVRVSAADPDFVPVDDVSQHLINAFLTTEDSGFYAHDGFVRGQFLESLIRNLEAGEFEYGASSITMQMVKNVLLGHEKTLSRKLQELFLTWYVETRLPKSRIMEIYLNAIEFGPGIYGIGEAARHYFGKDASELNPLEAAFFSWILPNPRGRYGQFCRGELRGHTERMLERILGFMEDRDRLSSLERQIAESTPLIFNRSEVESEAQCVRRARRALNSLPAMTPPLEREGEEQGEDEGGEAAEGSGEGAEEMATR